MMRAMCPPPTAEGARKPRPAQRAPADPPETARPGVLESLPRTRPQRPSPRRAAARRAAQAQQAPAAPAKTRRARPERARKAPPKPAEPPVPPQGFEAEEQFEPGRPVQPPNAAELTAAVAELLGEAAQAGLAAGGQLVKDALRRLAGG